MMTRLAEHLFVVGMMAAAGCIDSELELSSTEQHAGPSSSGGTHGGQGRFQMGGVADGFVGNAGMLVSVAKSATRSATPINVDISTVDATCLTATHNNITHTCSDTWFDNVTFTAPGGGALKIVAARTFTTTVAPVRSVTGYRLQYRAGAGAWTDYCANNHFAFPLRGEYFQAGAQLPSNLTTRISFACSEYTTSGANVVLEAVSGNGVLAKAVQWGFADQGNVVYTGNPAQSLTTLELLVTAAHMGRADYCNSGASNTLDNTAIGVMDFATGNLVAEASGPVEASPIAVDPTQEYLEAAWPLSNATLPGGGAPVPLCLSKLRWSTLPIGDICGARLRDPRLHADSIYCEDWSGFQQLAAAGAVLVNSSKYNDRLLRGWVAGTDNFVTTRGYVNGVHGADQPPDALTAFVSTGVEIGSLLTSTGVAVWQSAYPNGGGVTVELCTATNAAGEHALTRTTALPAGYTCSGPSEGFAWSVTPAQGILTSLGLSTRSLYRHFKASTGDYTVTTSSTPPAGYGGTVLLGTILAPRTL